MERKTNDFQITGNPSYPGFSPFGGACLFSPENLSDAEASPMRHRMRAEAQPHTDEDAEKNARGDDHAHSHTLHPCAHPDDRDRA